MSPWSNGSKRWSGCSVKQMRSFVTSRRALCLKNKPSSAGGNDDKVNFPEPDIPTTRRPEIIERVNHVVFDIFKWKDNLLNDFFSRFNLNIKFPFKKKDQKSLDDVTDLTDVTDVTEVTDVTDMTDVTEMIEVTDVTDMTDVIEVSDLSDV